MFSGTYFLEKCFYGTGDQTQGMHSATSPVLKNFLRQDLTTPRETLAPDLAASDTASAGVTMVRHCTRLEEFIFMLL